MNKKLILSVATISMALAAIGGVTIAYFSDTEISTGNKFTAGTIDIAVDNANPWTLQEGFQMLDMKPSYTEYIDFTIQNVGTNPANVWKELTNIVTAEGIMSEPECDEYGGTWVTYGDFCSGGTEKHDIDTVIGYDLSVELYDESGAKVWWQMLYNDDIMLSELPTGQNATDGMYLGMIPKGWSMKVHQSYHMDADTGNWAQGDEMTFDIELYAEQLKGTLVLEDKSGDPDWDINQASLENGVLTYQVMSPKFDFSFTGKAPSANKEYALVIGNNPWDGGQLLGTAMANSSGNVTIPQTSVELGQSYDHAKVWLILNSDWNNAAGKMSHWHGSEYLFETGLVEYRNL